ncbi:MAG TPA: hypothetical protein VGI60_14940 [Chthoniobacterales bacterium]|jgi:hypothetical protein
MTSFIDNEWIFIVVTGLVLLGASELGVRTGFRLHVKHDEARKSQLGGVQGAVLGLLGLLLGFTFAMAVARYDARREMVLKEANAIGTTWLRAGLLPGDHPKQVKELLRRYLNVRLEYREYFNDPSKLAKGLRASADIENAIWTHAEAAAKESPTPVVVSFISALNDMIDTDADRIAAGRNHIPHGVWVLVLFVAAFGCYTSAYNSGAQGARSNFTSLFLPLLLTIVIGLIFDIDHALQGTIGVSQQPLLELRENISR